MKFIPIHLPRPLRREEKPKEEAPEAISIGVTEAAMQHQVQLQSIASAVEVASAIENAKVDLQKYIRPQSGREAMTLDDVTLITEELTLLQGTLQGIHSDEDISELDRTLMLSFQATLPYYFQFGKRDDWKNALAELKQAIGLRIGDADQIKAANVDLLLLHCRAKDLYYDWMLYLNAQKLNSLKDERKQLILADAAETDIKQVASMIGTTENEGEIYSRAKSSNLVKMAELQEHKRLYAESHLFSGEMSRAIDQLIADNVSMMLSISEQVVADTHTAEKMIADRDAVNSVIRNQLSDSAPTLSAAARRLNDEEQQAHTHAAEEPMMQAQ